jgi:hypothetical protein
MNDNYDTTPFPQPAPSWRPPEPYPANPDRPVYRWPLGRRTTGLLLALLAVCGCWAWLNFSVRNVHIEPGWSSDRPQGPSLPVRVLYDGQVLATFDDWKEHTVAVRGWRSDLLQVEMLRPEGWVACEVDRSSWLHWNVYLSYYVRVRGKPRTVALCVDNRGHDSVELACGQVCFRVAADRTRRLSIPASADARRYPLTIDGRAVGALDGDNFLVDVSGTRSYRLHEQVYGGGLALLSPASIRRKPDVFYRGRPLHKLGAPVDFFLTPAPAQIRVRTLAIHGVAMPVIEERRTELLEEK